MPMPTLRTPRLVLSPFGEHDFADLLALNSDADVTRLIVLAHAHTSGCTRVMACASPENAGSIAVMKKIGMTYVGRGRMYGRESVVYRSTIEGA
jgi:RimJ/RimL family protein N-acetyltransferase